MHRHIARLGLAAAFAACLLAQDETPAAKIRSTPVLLRDLDPRDRAADPPVLLRGRADRLASMIWTAVKEEFCRTRDCTPTEAEIAQFQETMIKQKEQSIREIEAHLRDLDASIARQQPGSTERAKL